MYIIKNNKGFGFICIPANPETPEIGTKSLTRAPGA